MRKFLFLLLIPFFFTGCKKTDQSAVDQKIIQQYLTDHHITTAIAEPNGLYYIPTLAGTGAYPTISSTVTVNYKGYLTSGTLFDQSTRPVTFPLTSVIAGWQEGIPLMQTGGKATLIIPSALGYGGQSQSGIPANSVLIFDVELVSFY